MMDAGRGGFETRPYDACRETRTSGKRPPPSSLRSQSGCFGEAGARHRAGDDDGFTMSNSGRSGLSPGRYRKYSTGGWHCQWKLTRVDVYYIIFDMRHPGIPARTPAATDTLLALELTDPA